jgi:hypothetical protein
MTLYNKSGEVRAEQQIYFLHTAFICQVQHGRHAICLDSLLHERSFRQSNMHIVGPAGPILLNRP